MKEILNKIKGLTVTQWYGIGATLCALIAIIILIVMFVVVSTPTIPLEEFKREQRQETITPEKTRTNRNYTGDDFDILLETTIDDESFKSFEIYNSIFTNGNNRDVCYELELDSGTLKGMSAKDIFPEALVISQAGDIRIETILDSTPYSYVDGTPHTLRQLLWLIQNNDMGFILCVQDEYEWRANYKLYMNYNRNVKGFEQEVEIWVEGDSPEEVFGEAMEFLNTHTNPLWEISE